MLYRAAGANLNRDTILLVSRDGGETFESANLQTWKLQSCPMSSFALGEGGEGVLAAWETQKQIYRSTIAPGTTRFTQPVAATGDGPNRKHPALATTDQGETLLAWTEGTAWAKGGKLAWQVYDRDGNPTAEKGRVEGVRVWSLPSAVAGANGSFMLFY